MASVHHTIQNTGVVVHDMLLKIKPKDFNRGVQIPVSGLSHYPTVVIFKNETGRSVMVFWIDYSRNLQKYATMNENGSIFMCNSFIGHPWLAIDSVTGAQCLIDGRFVYTPENIRNPQHKIPERVTITMPVLTLYEYSLRMVVQSINVLQALDDPDMLHDLPRRLIEDIQEAIRKKIFVGKHDFNAFPLYSWFDLGILTV